MQLFSAEPDSLPRSHYGALAHFVSVKFGAWCIFYVMVSLSWSNSALIMLWFSACVFLDSQQRTSSVTGNFSVEHFPDSISMQYILVYMLVFFWFFCLVFCGCKRTVKEVGSAIKVSSLLILVQKGILSWLLYLYALVIDLQQACRLSWSVLIN